MLKVHDRVQEVPSGMVTMDEATFTELNGRDAVEHMRRRHGFAERQIEDGARQLRGESRSGALDEFGLLHRRAHAASGGRRSGHDHPD